MNASVCECECVCVRAVFLLLLLTFCWLLRVLVVTGVFPRLLSGLSTTGTGSGSASGSGTAVAVVSDPQSTKSVSFTHKE